MSKIRWEMDPAHSELNFKAKHMMVTNVNGTFEDFKVKVETEDSEIENAKVEVVANVNSVSTRVGKRDEHLKSADFFDAENHPEISFKSTSFKKIEDDDYELKGDLTIRGVTKPVTLDVELGGQAKDPWGGVRAGFSVSGKINRGDWGLNYNAALETGGVLVSDTIKIYAEVEMVQKEEALA